jgi:hypothetical protein
MVAPLGPLELAGQRSGSVPGSVFRAGNRKGKERKGKERKGKERKGKERKGKERKGRKGRL